MDSTRTFSSLALLLGVERCGSVKKFLGRRDRIILEVKSSRSTKRYVVGRGIFLDAIDCRGMNLLQC